MGIIYSEEENMETEGIRRTADYLVPSINTIVQKEPDRPTEAEAQTPEPVEDTGKRLDLFA